MLDIFLQNHIHILTLQKTLLTASGRQKPTAIVA
jgi:hypothetical protein